jgi:hypothetical protein
MHGVPRDLDLSRFVGATLVQICLGAHQVQFHFQGADAWGPKVPSISVEGGWELRDAGGKLLDGFEECDTRETYRVHRILAAKVVGTAVDAPGSFALRFESGEELRIFDDNGPYESFSIGDLHI